MAAKYFEVVQIKPSGIVHRGKYLRVKDACNEHRSLVDYYCKVLGCSWAFPGFGTWESEYKRLGLNLTESLVITSRSGYSCVLAVNEIQ